MTARPSTLRIIAGGTITVVLMSFVVSLISAQFMDWTAAMLGEKVAWPQIAFMSEYPKDVRNGYLLFVIAIFTTVLLSSGLIAGVLGASLGKWLCGIRYVRADGRPVGLSRAVLRASLYCVAVAPVLLLGPGLGFVFGDAADAYSLVALALGSWLFVYLTSWPSWADYRLSWLNHTSGVEPVLAS